MEEIGWSGPDFGSLSEKPKEPEKKDAKREKSKRVQYSWSDLVRKSKESGDNDIQSKVASGADKAPADNVEHKPAPLFEEGKPSDSSEKGVEQSEEEIDKLSTQEQASVLKQTAREGAESARAEQDGPLGESDPGFVAAKAAEEFHDVLSQQAEVSDLQTALDAAEKQAIDSVDSLLDRPESSELDDELDMIEDTDPVAMDEASDIEIELETEDEDPDLDRDATTHTTPSHPVSPLVVPPIVPPSPILPPPTPIPPIAPPPPVINAIPPSPPSPISFRHKSLDARSSANEQSRHSHWPYVLTGGVVGYLIGRRRGRIKTEDKLLPIQKSLELQVQDLQWQVAEREARVRKFAYERVATKFVVVEKGASPGDLESTNKLPKSNTEKIADVDTAKHPLVNKQAESVVDRPSGTQSNAESTVGAIETLATESALLGRVGLMSPDISTGSFETSSRVVDNSGNILPKTPENITRDAAKMNTQELLAIAEKIPVGQYDVRYLFETGRLSKDGLIKIVESYMRGENINHKIQENILEYEGIELLPAPKVSHSDPIPISNMAKVDDVAGQDNQLAVDLAAEVIDRKSITESSSKFMKTGFSESISDRDSILLGVISGVFISAIGIIIYIIVK